VTGKLGSPAVTAASNSALDPAVVGHEVRHLERLLLPLAAAEHEVQLLRLDALDPLELLHVRAHLEDRGRLGVARQLRIGDLVRPRTEVARRVDPEQEVGEAEPRPVEERCLVDDVRAVEHCPFRGGCLGPQPVAARHGLVVQSLDLDNRVPGRLEIGEVALLVGLAALRDELDRRVATLRLVHEAGHGRPLEREAVGAGQESDEVRRRVDGPAVDQLHE
jgi:hypothetical protein